MMQKKGLVQCLTHSECNKCGPLLIVLLLKYDEASLAAQLVKNLHAMQETLV